MALPNAKSFIPNVAQKAKSVVSGIAKAAKEVSYNVTAPRSAAQADKSRAAVKLARQTKGLSFDAAVKNKMFDVANAKTDTARIYRNVAKRKAAKLKVK